MINNEKIVQLTQKLNEQNIDTYLILSREDSDTVLPLLIPAHVVAQTAFFFRSDGKHYVLTGRTDANMYTEMGIFEVIESNDDFDASFKELFDSLNVKRLALNISEHDYLIDGLTVGQYMKLQNIIGKETLKEIEVSSETFIQDLRAIKSDYEIEQISIAVRKTCTIYKKVRDEITVGMSETDIGELFVKGMREQGVVNAFDEPYSYPLICIVRCGLAHRKPNPANILQDNDILVVDFSVRYNGYCSDIARSFYVLPEGEEVADEQSLRAFETTLKAVSTIIDGIRPGMKGWEVDKLGRDVIEQSGYPTIRHASGHQLGRQVHDGGTALSYDHPDRPAVRQKVRDREVYAIEPTVIQDDGKPSFIVEEDIVMTPQGAKILSERQMELYYIRRSRS
ncbi:MAG: M24 family metallopeptidase [Sphaerochaetaceae bacterium]